MIIASVVFFYFLLIASALILMFVAWMEYNKPEKRQRKRDMGPIFKYTVAYCWGYGDNTGDDEMVVEALDIIQAATIAKAMLRTDFGDEVTIVSVVQED